MGLGPSMMNALDDDAEETSRELALIKSLRQQVAVLKNKCKAADELAEFYGDFESWEATGWDAQDLIDESDIEEISGEDLPKGGKRARQFKKDYPKTEEV